MKRKYRVILAVIALYGLVLGLFASVSTAAVTWNASTLQSVDDPSGNIYTYAPSVVVDGNTEHIYTCHNKVSGSVHDSIYYTKRVNGTVVESKEVLVSGPNGAWDDFHLCDPSVVAGKFNYNGTLYNYAMFYLGNNDDCSCNNQIGVAFSNDLSANSWVKYPNAIVQHPTDGTWGLGQPAATSVDGNGRVLLFYTGEEPQANNDWGAWRRDINLNNLSAPSIGAPVKLTTSGLNGTDGAADYLNNFDVAYDGARDRFFIIREMHPYPASDPNFIGDSLEVASIPAANIWSGGGTWQREAVISPSLTGFARNHNGGIARNAWGVLPSSTSFKAVFTDSCANCGNSLWSYDLWSITGSLTDGAGGGGSSIESGKTYALYNRKTNNVLDCYTSTNGSQCYTWDWTNVANQKWIITDVGGGYYKMINAYSNKALDNYDATNGSSVYAWDYVSGIDQQWQIIATSDGYYKIINKKTGKALDAYNDVNGDPTYAWDYVNGLDQQWQLVKLN
ncbi:RICIN domain-containing protein [Paenibacillus sp. BC26]|uniref:RICIN domain-containing protein n=1 Tax=Paenibacillus sp. BC26 TaxID=1881032 RepID=UPI0008EF94B5|nr:RICIN domain-containing protein [Paenibacillus sp. BC26]SFS87719.1 Ricin-type beta-trefoil lectin domain-like [Paenibacillus sp. BC26]